MYNTATTVNGFLADRADSLDWLYAVQSAAPDLEPFLAEVSVLVMGSTTYEWVLRAENLLEHPEKWASFFGTRPAFVFSSRTLPLPHGADIRVVNGPVAGVLQQIVDAAGGGTVWLQGGGDLVGQFLDVGALDEIVLSIAPAFLDDGRPLLPRVIPPDRLQLEEAGRVDQFLTARYRVLPDAEHP